MKRTTFGIWIASNYGIECKKNGYYIEAERLLERRGNLPEWPLHMAEKNWSDIGNFIKAFLYALEHNEKVLKMPNQFTREELQKCVNKALLDHFYIPSKEDLDILNKNLVSAEELMTLSSRN